MLIDGNGAIFGRLASIVAKNLLNGEQTTVVNADNIIISGDPRVVKERFLAKLHRGSPLKGPFIHRYPDRLFSRAVRGMLPNNARGRDALKRLRVHRKCPEEFKNLEKIGKNREDLKAKYITLANLSKELGAKA